ncbi:hypothetical protein [Luteibacter sp. 22Crub2.1]|uniref:hypothetical protein n=1 Tax=Luteibacter sp. 22Crub2.1 TaxID=1283288 RepID=UPI0011176A2E|nr:hypothetical protein [Luteibacter sp. 22Crub2.1]
MKADTSIRLLLWTLAATLTILPIIYVSGSLELKDFWDFLSYELPCAAGVCAGAGLYFGKAKDVVLERASDRIVFSAEKLFYLFSVLLLLAGLVCYILTHRCAKPAIVTIAVAAFIVTLIFFGVRVIADMSRNSYIGGFLLFMFSAIAIVGIVFFMLYWKAFYFSVQGVHYCTT